MALSAYLGVSGAASRSRHVVEVKGTWTGVAVGQYGQLYCKEELLCLCAKKEGGGVLERDGGQWSGMQWCT